MNPSKKKQYTKIALTLSAVLMIIWGLLGTSASLAWFSDTDETQRNVFQVADFDVEVSYLQDGDWIPLDGAAEVFDRNALYEPGYVQVVYLRICNAGDVAFDYNIAVTVAEETPGKNVFGAEFHLNEHLTFGLETAKDPATLQQSLAKREDAIIKAQMPLNTYATDTPIELKEDETHFAALIVCMSKSVNNIANYREQQPSLQLGITVQASQQNMPAQD